jgi:hypothetical protein
MSEKVCTHHVRDRSLLALFPADLTFLRHYGSSPCRISSHHFFYHRYSLYSVTLSLIEQREVAISPGLSNEFGRGRSLYAFRSPMSDSRHHPTCLIIPVLHIAYETTVTDVRIPGTHSTTLPQTRSPCFRWRDYYHDELHPVYGHYVNIVKSAALVTLLIALSGICSFPILLFGPVFGLDCVFSETTPLTTGPPTRWR